MQRHKATLSEFARVGFAQLSDARELLGELGTLSGREPAEIVGAFAEAADPDSALRSLLDIERAAPGTVGTLSGDEVALGNLMRVSGASTGLGSYFVRHPEALDALAEVITTLPAPEQLRDDFAVALGISTDGFSAESDEKAWSVLRTRYRWWLARIAAFDLSHPDPCLVVDQIAATLADLAAATIDAALAVARTQVSTPGAGPSAFPRDEVAATKLAVIGMGKAGASELNYVSDVDVIFVAEGDEDAGLSHARAVDIATRMAMYAMRVINEASFEPSLWEVDPNLRPEGKAGALVRTLESHLAYYERWAKSWEFQALLKARAMAGDRELGERYVEGVAPKVWGSAARENFVESVQRMRERVTEHIPADEVQFQIKLGPGGLRDIEFTVQLLQLVHGLADDQVRQRGTLPALGALADNSYIGRQEAAEFAEAYRLLRVLEHRLQLTRLRRTHLMPRDEDALRVLARASKLAGTGPKLVERWERTKHDVRSLHERLFYRPLLSAVAALPEAELALTTDQAEARLAAIGFRDAKGALAHIGALTAGVSRRATIQRHLLPIMLRWFADGSDPDYGLLAFRRLSDALGSTHWFLRMLRDSSAVAERLTRVLSGSRFIGELMEKFPEAAAWLENDEQLRPRSAAVLRDEVGAIFSRHEKVEIAARSVLRARRREILRLALSSVLGVSSISELAAGLTDITTMTISGVLQAIRSANPGDAELLEFAVIGMGRYGGQELGFGSDADVLYVYRALTDDTDAAAKAAARYAADLKRLTEDPRLPLDLDLGLRPEGKNGPLVRSLDSYRAYYARWSLTWEAQALLRARGVAGDGALIADFETLADSIRYPASISEQDVREVKRIKARVEGERLPQGADPGRHLKLGRGSLSDVEWFVQLLQLQHGAEVPGLRTTSTLGALAVAQEEGLVTAKAAENLRKAWVLASRVRSAMTLWLNRTSDVLPSDRQALEGVARVLGYEHGAANQLEEDYLAVTRRARKVFEREFYGAPLRVKPSGF